MTVLPMGSALKKALDWASGERKCHPEKRLLALVDEAGMRFNLSPSDSDALHRLLSVNPETPR